MVGGPSCERQLAWDWVGIKEAEKARIAALMAMAAADSVPAPNVPVNSEAESARPDTVFIVHGHDEASLHMVARFVEQLGLKAIVLHERPNKGRTIITKFQEEAAGIGFAIVLMTPDDLGKAKDAAGLKSRARQNVVFEFGFFIGALRPERVAALVKGDIERPSDLDGVVYISLDKPTGELSSAGSYKLPVLQSTGTW